MNNEKPLPKFEVGDIVRYWRRYEGMVRRRYEGRVHSKFYNEDHGWLYNISVYKQIVPETKDIPIFLDDFVNERALYRYYPGGKKKTMEKKCEDCKYWSTKVCDEPCVSCDCSNNRWEPKGSIYSSDRKKRCSTCKWWYLTGSSEPCRSCVTGNSNKWEPKDKDDYKIGDVVNYHVMDVDDIKTELKTGTIIAKEAHHSNYDFTITDDFECVSWGVNKEWIVEKVLLTTKDESSMYPSTIGKTFASEYIKNDCESVKSFLNDIYGINKTKENTMKKNDKLIRMNGKYKKEIKKVIFSGPATTIVFEDELDIPYGRVIKPKTTVKCQDGDKFDKTTGFSLALLKTFVDKNSYNNILRTIDGFEEENKECKDVRDPNTDWIAKLPLKEQKKLFLNLGKVFRETREKNDFKFQVGDIVKLKNGNSLYEVVKCNAKEYNKRIVRYYRLKSTSPSEYLTTEREERLVLAED